MNDMSCVALSSIRDALFILRGSQLFDLQRNDIYHADISMIAMC